MVLGNIISEPTPLIIAEITGSKNNLILEGRALPYRPLTFEGTMRAEVTWYPGNPQGSLQMLGVQEQTTTINGMWKDRFMSAFDAFGIPILTGRTARATFNGQDIGNIRDLVEVIEGFRFRGQLIEFSWDQFVRQGYLKRFRQTWLRREDVEWELEFEWINRGEPTTPVAFGIRSTVFDTISELSSAIDDLRVALSAPFAFVSSFRVAIDTSLNAIEQAGAAVASVANKAADALLTPLQIARSTLAAFQTLKTESSNIANLFESAPARAQRISAFIPDLVFVNGSVTQQDLAAGTNANTADVGIDVGAEGGQILVVDESTPAPTSAPQVTSLTETAGISQLTHEQAVQAEATKRDVRKAARVIKSIASQRAQEIEADAIRIPDIRSYSARDGDDLRDVSTLFYDNQEEWKRLLIYNNLANSKLSGGQIILIPPIDLPESNF